eukprot:COSAG05_NODE_10579_length_557_cov_12.441048_1_plen_42_part_10
MLGLHVLVVGSYGYGGRAAARVLINQLANTNTARQLNLQRAA